MAVTEDDLAKAHLSANPSLFITGKSKAYPIWQQKLNLGLLKRLWTKELKQVRVELD